MWQGFLQIALTLLPLAIITPLLGKYMARVFRFTPTILDPVCAPIERGIYRLSQIDDREMMTGWQYARAIFISNLVMAIAVFVIQMTQGVLPLNPTTLSAPTWDTALHTTISFLTNTDQQHYSGETTYSYASQVFGLGFLMFTSAATGLSVGIAFIRGLTGVPLGNFYVDLVR
jgi:K+-transporting ATPase ATPase A chain